MSLPDAFSIMDLLRLLFPFLTCLNFALIVAILSRKYLSVQCVVANQPCFSADFALFWLTVEACAQACLPSLSVSNYFGTKLLRNPISNHQETQYYSDNFPWTLRFHRNQIKFLKKVIFTTFTVIFMKEGLQKLSSVLNFLLCGL